MNSEAVKANEIKFFEYVNNRDTKAMGKWIDEFVAEDFINHNPALDVENDREGLKDMFNELFKLFPDMKIVIKEMIYENNIICFQHIVRGVGIKDSMGIAMIKFKDGKITDRWNTTE